MSRGIWGRAARVEGQELDAEVAESVFGWTRFEAGGRVYFEHDGGLIAYPGLGSPFPLPRYSADIASAWSVVEAMWKRGWNADLHVCGDGYVCAFDDMSRYARAAVDPREGGPALAICLAALQAVAET